MTIHGCGKQEKAPAGPPAPVPAEPTAQLIPEPPPVPSSTDCVVRRFDVSDGTWRTNVYPYDEATRTLGTQEPLAFDDRGRLVAVDDAEADDRETVTYDEHGNLYEWIVGPRSRLLRGTRWDNIYQGDPPRLTDQTVFDLDEKGRRAKLYSRIHFGYDADGQVFDELFEEPRGKWKREYHWKGPKIARVLWSHIPRPPNATLPFEVEESFEYDAKGRLISHVVDGEMMFGEGAPANGRPDERKTFEYDTAGHLVRIERDGQNGDVGPEAPDGTANVITLLTPQCDAFTQLAPALFDVPEVSLPPSLAPHFR